MSRAQALADRIGRAIIAETLGVTVDAVAVSIKRGGKLPAAWFPVVRDLCVARGIECPESAFNWKSPSSAPSGAEAAE